MPPRLAFVSSIAALSIVSHLRADALTNSTAAVTSAVPARVLSLAEALDLASRQNADVQLARLRMLEAAGAMKSTRAALLPQVGGEASQGWRQRSASASGQDEDIIYRGTYATPFRGPQDIQIALTSPETIGPYGIFDANASLALTLFNLQKLNEYKASRAGEELSRLQMLAASQTIMSKTAELYCRIQFDEEAVKVSRQKVNLWQKRVTMVKDQLAAGVATALDVQKEEQGVSVARRDLKAAENDLAFTRMEFALALGFGVGDAFGLSDPLEFRPFDAGVITNAVGTALSRRADYLSLKQVETVATHQRDAAKKAYWPQMDIYGSYGAQGEYVDDVVDAYGYGARLAIPIWDSWKRRGDLEQQESRLAQAQNRTLLQKQSIAEEIRTALEGLALEAQSVGVAREAVRIAEGDVAREKDREKSGTGTPLAVVGAEVSLADAKYQHTQAIYQYNVASEKWFAAIGDVMEWLPVRASGQPRPDANTKEADQRVQ